MIRRLRVQTLKNCLVELDELSNLKLGKLKHVFVKPSTSLFSSVNLNDVHITSIFVTRGYCKYNTYRKTTAINLMQPIFSVFNQFNQERIVLPQNTKDESIDL